MSKLITLSLLERFKQKLIAYIDERLESSPSAQPIVDTEVFGAQQVIILGDGQVGVREDDFGILYVGTSNPAQPYMLPLNSLPQRFKGYGQKMFNINGMLYYVSNGELTELNTKAV